jgi:hypothetical protein
MEFTGGEFLRVGSQTFWEQAGLENFVFAPPTYAPSEIIQSEIEFQDVPSASLKKGLTGKGVLRSVTGKNATLF